jgi:ribosomal protein S27AE
VPHLPPLVGGDHPARRTDPTLPLGRSHARRGRTRAEGRPPRATADGPVSDSAGWGYTDHRPSRFRRFGVQIPAQQNDRQLCDRCGYRLDPVILSERFSEHPACAYPLPPPSPTRAELQRRSHQAVRTAIRNGTIIPPELCEICGADSPLVAHHPDSTYAEENQLQIVFVCARCHRAEHRVTTVPRTKHTL